MDAREEAEEFDKAHGDALGHAVSADGVWCVFPDGCRRGVKCWPVVGYQFIEPEPDSKDAHFWQQVFWEIRLQNLVDEFTDLKSRCQTLARHDGGRFAERLAELKQLETAVRSARAKLSRATTVLRGYTSADVSRAWEIWQEFSEAAECEALSRGKYEAALLGKSSAGVLEKLKHRFDEAKRQSERTLQKWNDFEPAEARSIVNQELDAQRRADRERELSEIEV